MNWIRYGLLISCCYHAWLGAAWAESSHKAQLNMAVYAFQDIQALQHGYDALALALNERLSDYQLRIQVMDADAIMRALEQHQVDVLFTNPVIYQRLRKQYTLISPLATAQMRYRDRLIASLGGVIFQRADKAPIESLTALLDQRIAIPSQTNTGAFALPAYELYKLGIGIEQLDWLTFDNNDEVVRAVLSNKADVGFVRTGVLEDWIDSRQLNRQDIRVIHQQLLSAFPLLLSTELLPEWPVYALSHVPEAAIKDLTVALFAIDATWPSAAALNINSFIPPADYFSLEKILTALRLPPFDAIPALKWSEIWQLYQLEILAALLTFTLLLGLLLWIMHLYQQVKHASVQLRQASLIFDASIEGIVVTDAQRRIVNVNRAFESISGYRKSEVLGLDPRFLKSGKQPDTFYATMWQQLNQTGFWRGEVLNRRKNGALYPELLTIYAISNHKQEVQNYVAIFSDISQQKAQQAKLERLLHYDVLTGLPNRSLLNDRVKQALINAREQQHCVAIVFIDLDGFKAVNDTYGHNAGDALLIELGNRFLTIMRSQCTIARIGGDEFIAVMTHLLTRESAYPVLDQLLAVCNQPFLVNGEETVTISASIGVDFYTPSDYDREVSEINLIKQADKAMYIAKQQGKNQIWFFDQNHHSIEQGLPIHGA